MSFFTSRIRLQGIQGIFLITVYILQPFFQYDLAIFHYPSQKYLILALSVHFCFGFSMCMLLVSFKIPLLVIVFFVFLLLAPPKFHYGRLKPELPLLYKIKFLFLSWISFISLFCSVFWIVPHIIWYLCTLVVISFSSSQLMSHPKKLKCGICYTGSSFTIILVLIGYFLLKAVTFVFLTNIFY